MHPARPLQLVVARQLSRHRSGAVQEVERALVIAPPGICLREKQKHLECRLPAPAVGCVACWGVRSFWVARPPSKRASVAARAVDANAAGPARRSTANSPHRLAGGASRIAAQRHFDSIDEGAW